MVMEKKKYSVAALCLSILLLCFVSFFSACNEEDSGLIFPHSFHTNPDGEVGAECSDCHMTDVNGQKMKLPTHEECSQCHDIEEGKIESTECNKCHTRDDRKVFVKFVKLAPKDLIFSHKNHTDRGTECEQCHPEIINREKVSFADIPKMEKCFECHNEKETNCSKCHSEIRENRKPIDNELSISHDLSWKTLHRNKIEGNEKKCILCHQTSKCQDCHLKNKPSSHTLSWKQDIHGRYATQNRDKCAVCHQADFCSRCHQQKPTTHFEPNWVPNHRVVAKRNARSCLVCHKKDFCGVCHTINLKKLVK
ncbi:MAG: hypothetical protein D6734_09750 [Candidatus Schekmanbacteria bacterium]|nr:MAG: hypothetical protein D6734_09750 [Candidatus Schekmanbacteria bacterium]